MKGILKLTSGIKIKSPSDKRTRPTAARVREALFNICRGDIEGSSWLDLCSGSGVVGCEALQNGANKILAIERNRSNAAICKSNLLYISEKTGRKNNVQVVCDDVIGYLKKNHSENQINLSNHDPNKNKSMFDFIFFDPPYEKEIYTSTIEHLSFGNLIKSSTILICECSQKHIPLIPEKWKLIKQRTYGKSCLLFLTPNPALHYFDGIGSKRQQIIQAM